MNMPRWVALAFFWAGFLYLVYIILALPGLVEVTFYAIAGGLTYLWGKDKWTARRASKNIDEEYRLLIEESRKRR